MENEKFSSSGDNFFHSHPLNSIINYPKKKKNTAALWFIIIMINRESVSFIKNSFWLSCMTRRSRQFWSEYKKLSKLNPPKMTQFAYRCWLLIKFQYILINSDQSPGVCKRRLQDNNRALLRHYKSKICKYFDKIGIRDMNVLCCLIVNPNRQNINFI